MVTLDLTRHGAYQRKHHAVTDEKLAALIQSTADRLERVHSEAAKAIAAIRLDLPPDLQAAERVRIAEWAAGELAPMLKQRDTLGKAVELGGAIRSASWRNQVPVGADPAEWRAAQREVRDTFRPLDQTERDLAHSAAAETGNRLIVSALETCPSGRPLISAHFLEQGAEAFAKATAPDQYALLLEQEAALYTISGDLERCAAEVGIQALDPLAAVLGAA